MKRDEKLLNTAEFNNMFKNAGNKIRLQQFLKTELHNIIQIHGGIRVVYSLGISCWDLTSTESKIISEYQCCHIEADTVIFYIYSQIRKSGVTDAIVIDAEDTDVIVLAAHVSHKIEGILGIKRKNDIFDCKLLCSESDAEIIVPLHIHTGADAISGFFGHGKKSVVKATFKSKEAHRLLENIGKTLNVNQNIFDEITKFTIKFI